MFKYVHENRCRWDKDTCIKATEYGQLECLKYAHENGCPLDKYLSYIAAQNGHIKCLEYLHLNNCMWDEATCMHSVYANLNCLFKILFQK